MCKRGQKHAVKALMLYLYWGVTNVKCIFCIVTVDVQFSSSESFLKKKAMNKNRAELSGLEFI